MRQVDHAKSLHYVGAGVAFPAGLLFVCLQCVLTYRVAVTALDYWMAHFRVALTLGALVSLILSILEQPGPSLRSRSTAASRLRWEFADLHVSVRAPHISGLTSWMQVRVGGKNLKVMIKQTSS